MLLLKYLVVHLRHLIEDHVPQSSHPSPGHHPGSLSLRWCAILSWFSADSSSISRMCGMVTSTCMGIGISPVSRISVLQAGTEVHLALLPLASLRDSSGLQLRTLR